MPFSLSERKTVVLHVLVPIRQTGVTTLIFDAALPFAPRRWLAVDRRRPLDRRRRDPLSAARAARRISPEVDTACEPKLFSEDFAHFANRAPGCFLLLGNGTEGAHARPLHSADYDFNDAALVPGSSLWVTLVEQELPGGG